MAAPERFSHSCSLFITDRGPMRFYVRPGPLKRQLSPLITHGGGIVCRVQEPGAFLLAEPGQAQGLKYISSSYITDCVHRNRRLSARAYRLQNRLTGARGEGEDPVESAVSCDQSTNKGGHTALSSNPAGSRGTPSRHRVPSTGAPASCDPGATIGGDSLMTDKPKAELITESRRDNFSVKPTTSGTGTVNPDGKNPVEDHAKKGEASGQGGLECRPPRAARRVLFTRQEDITILRYVQENKDPKRSEKGNLLWKELEEKQLLRRTWQSMKYRYTSYIQRRKHQYMLSLKGPDQAAAEIPNANHPGGPSFAAFAQDIDPLPAETPLRSPSPEEDPHCAADPMEGACTDLPDRDEDISRPGGSTVRWQLRRVNGIIDSSSEREEGKRMHKATSKRLPVPQEDPDDESEDLQIFEIANLEFEVEDDGFVCKAKVPRLTLKDFVMGEDSASGNTQLQMDDVHSSPGVSDCEGLQDAMTDLMREYKLDICQVTQALLKNNGEVGSTRLFLHSGLRPDGFPIWEHQDDVDLQSDDPSVQAQLAKKYGADNVAKRTAFLAS